MMKYNIFLYNMYYHTLNTFYIQAFRYSTLDLIGPDWIINWIQKKKGGSYQDFPGLVLWVIRH